MTLLAIPRNGSNNKSVLARPNSFHSGEEYFVILHHQHQQ